MSSQDTDTLLTRTEAEVMQAVWQLGTATVHEVRAALSRPLAYTTVLSIMQILERKGYVTHRPAPEGGRAYVYEASVVQRTAQRRHLRDLVERLFDGHAPQLVSGLLEDERLSRSELEALRGMIDAKIGALPGTNKKARKR